MKDRSRPPQDADSREARLKAALRANLARRKAQARARGAEAGPQHDQTPQHDGDNEDGHGQHHRQG